MPAFNDLETARSIALAVQKAGGRVFYVGGFVRDRLLGIANKDIDIEVHGIPLEQLCTILDAHGERTAMGAGFEVLGLKHCGLDISLPRKENAKGGDLAACCDPYLGPEKAAARRDFTINAMMEDVLTGEVLDFFGGRQDLEAGVIRHVGSSCFVQDPLRVFRAAQFAARFGFSIAPETRLLASQVNTASLACERVFTELEKALLKSPKPSLFFEELRAMRQLRPWFGELEALISTEQDPVFHPEGSAWVHTMQVLDEAAARRDRAQEPLFFMLSALCHDYGKAISSQKIDGRIHAYEHEIKGLPLVKGFLRRLTSNRDLLSYADNMVRWHMQPNALCYQNAGAKAYLKMFDRSVCPGDLLLIAQADHFGRSLTPERYAELTQNYIPMQKTLDEMYALFRQRMALPAVTGRDLIDAGFQPGPPFSQALEYAHRLQLAGVKKEAALPQTLAYLAQLLAEEK